MIIIPEEKNFYAQVLDQVERTQNGKIIITKFLTLREQAIYKEIVKGKDVTLQFNGGYPFAERRKACLFPRDLNIDVDCKIECLKITYNQRFLDITHRNVLGSLMSLGLERSLFGDIVLGEKEVYIFVSREIVPVLYNEFTHINQVPIDLTPHYEEVLIEPKYDQKEIIISSMRIDNLISHVYNLSRDNAKKHIQEGLVYRNFLVCKDADEICQVGDIVSVRNFGRFKIGELLRTTKTGKLVVLILLPSA